MRRFHLVRMEDVSGVSGTGRVAEGVEFHDGQTVLSWFGQYHTVAIYAKAQDIIDVHGHGGRTIIQWIDEEAK